MECVEKKNPEDQSAYPVPFGHVPYCPSLPGAMGPLWDFPTEWWYYAGWATDLTGSKQFTIYINTIRGLLTAAALEYTIGSTTSPGSKEYQIESSITEGLGNFPPATSTSWSISLDTVQSSSITCKLLSGTLGLPGATYQLEMVDDKNKVSLSLKDTFGMVMEGASGAQELQSYEYAMPSLSIQENSTITLAGVTTQLGSGSLWLDRQSINNNPKFVGRRFCSASKSDSGDSQRPLYTGNWLTVALNNDDQTVTRYMFAYFWPPKPNQWIVGSELEPPVYPRKKIGLEYPALPGWDGVSPVQGVNVLKNVDFDLNILIPKDPAQSPHWTSPTSGHTYCSAWRLRIRDKVYKMAVLIPESEVKAFSQAYFEGAAIISDENGCEAGRAFVEQMGYN